ncbi:MAG TPA: hypothetical protein VMX74_00080 [Pirellulales bacterium]|nr:hypothetical protein [Pirellulales bacterium]
MAATSVDSPIPLMVSRSTPTASANVQTVVVTAIASVPPTEVEALLLAAGAEEEVAAFLVEVADLAIQIN